MGSLFDTTWLRREDSGSELLKVSQAGFARLLNVPVVMEASWEVGRRNPSGAALRLLQIAKREPEVLLAAAEA